MSGTTLIVHLVDDDRSFLKAISRLLRAGGFAVKTFSSGAEFLRHLPESAPGCVIADLLMPGINGLQLQTALARSPQVMPVIFLTGQGDIPSSVNAMRNGAEDFLEKTAPKEKILAAVRRAFVRAAGQNEAKARHRELQTRFNSLSARERQVLGEVMQGGLNKQIAANLGISERTVKAHRAAIAARLGVPSVAEMVGLAHEFGFEAASIPICPKVQ
jgi:FixJ family two-component response regulator